MPKNAPRLELHIIQNFPPHNLNRDDSGAPKDTEFGGYRRARISSQCLKRSIRWSDAFGSELGGRIATRTKRSAGELADLLTTRHGRDATAATQAARSAIGKLISATDDKGNTSVLFYVGPDELEALAGHLNDAWETIAPALVTEDAGTSTTEEPEKADKKTKGKGKKAKAADSALDDVIKPVVDAYLAAYDGTVATVDVALFGRMLAENPTLNIDAACHVAHAISTNRVSMEFDYFTAVDDLQKDEETGAAMIGTTMFNSSCFYRYAVVDVGQLYRNLGGNGRPGTRAATLEGLRAFIKGAIAAMPTGKQSSTAAYTQPAFVMAVVRPDGGQPVSLANAFEMPVRPSIDRSLVAASVEAIDKHWGELATMYRDMSARPFVAVMESANILPTLGPSRCTSIDEMLESSLAAVETAWQTGGAA